MIDEEEGKKLEEAVETEEATEDNTIEFPELTDEDIPETEKTDIVVTKEMAEAVPHLKEGTVLTVPKAHNKAEIEGDLSSDTISRSFIGVGLDRVYLSGDAVVASLLNASAVLNTNVQRMLKEQSYKKSDLLTSLEVVDKLSIVLPNLLNSRALLTQHAQAYEQQVAIEEAHAKEQESKDQE